MQSLIATAWAMLALSCGVLLPSSAGTGWPLASNTVTDSATEGSFATSGSVASLTISGVSTADDGAGLHWTPTVCQSSAGQPDGYSPPLVANGDIAFRIGPLGDNSTVWCEKACTPPIFREGRRYGSERKYELVSFGHYRLSCEIGGKELGAPLGWEQTLDLRRGCAVCRADYPQGVRVTTTVAVPLGKPMVLIRREVSGAADCVQKLAYTCPTNEWARFEGNVTLSPLRVEGADAEWSIVFSDRIEPFASDAVDVAAELERNAAAWRMFWAASKPPPVDPAIQGPYLTALYHLRCNATKWSQPVGIANDEWAGRYFGWDEFFCQMGLLSAGHPDLARRVPEFRASVLGAAQARVGYYNRPGQFGARYPWETLEDGSDGTPPGFWCDHIFHESHIAASAWEQYTATGDLGYLKRTAWPVIRDMARFFYTHTLYEDATGGLYVGKFTDLERLGPAKERAFMTTCGVLYTLKIAAEASRLVGESADEAATWMAAAHRLAPSLPEREERFTALPDASVESIATLAGFFPYPLFDATEPRAVKALRHFVGIAHTAGNMYPTGKRVCSWYAGWLAVAAAQAGEREIARRYVREAAASAGLFGECWEINEPGVVLSRPWFATASGMFVLACNRAETDDAGKGINK